MVVVGLLATLGLVATAVVGYVEAQTDDGLRHHILVGLGSILVFVLAHLWILVYLFGSVRVLRTECGEAGLRFDRELGRFATHTLPPLIAALALGTGCFVLGAGVYSSYGSVLVHAVMFYVLLPVEGWAAWRSWRTFAAAERSIRELQAV